MTARAIKLSEEEELCMRLSNLKEIPVELVAPEKRLILVDLRNNRLERLPIELYN